MRQERSPSIQKEWSPTDSAFGFSTVEAVLAASVFAMIVTAFVGAYLYGQEATTLGGNRVRAALLAEEGLEAARNIRDAGFANLTDGVYGLAVSGNAWTFSGSQDVNGIFTRHIDVASLDARRKSVTSTVTWQQNPQRTGTVSIATRLTNWLAVGGGNWAYPFQEASRDAAGTNDGIRIATQGNYAYLIRNGGTNFLIYDVSVPASPTLAGSLTLSGTPTDIAVSGDYAYVANQSNTQELQIIRVSVPAAPVLVGTYDAPGTANARGVFVNGTTAYVVRDSSTSNEFLIMNAGTPSSPTLSGSLNLGATGYEVTVVGSYAYVASGQDSQELQVVRVSTPSSPVLAGSLNISGTGDATTIAGAADGLVIGRGNMFHAVTLPTPTSPALVGSLVIAGTVNDIAVSADGAYAFIGTNVPTGEFQVIDLSTFSAPTLLSSVNIAGSTALNGVAYNEGLDRVFGASAANTLEFLTFAPQ